MISRTKIVENLDIAKYYLQYNISGKQPKMNGEWTNFSCPLPDHGSRDSKPSFGFSPKSGVCKCFKCGHGSIFWFDAKMNGGTEDDTKTRLSKLAGLDNSEDLEAKIRLYHNNLLSNVDNSLNIIKNFRISDTAIRDLQLGYMRGYGRHIPRFIFPIFDTNGLIVTLKKYSPNPGDQPKCTFERGGKNFLYGIHQLNGNIEKIVILCAGEKDKTVGESLLGDKFTFVTFVGGEGSIPGGVFLQKAQQAIKDRNIVIAYDADKAGKKGALKAAQALHSFAKTVKIMIWPEEFEQQFPKGDITDYFTEFCMDTVEACNKFSDMVTCAPQFVAPAQEMLLQANKQCEHIEETPIGYNRVSFTKQGSISKRISNFIIVPKRAVELPSGEEIVECEFIHDTRERRTVFFQQKDWNIKREFLAKLPSHRYWFGGSEADIQYIKGIIGEYNIPALPGTSIFGKVQSPDGNSIYVLPGTSIGQNDSQVVFVPSPTGNQLTSHFLSAKSNENPNEFLKALFPLLYDLHETQPLHCALGWIFATSFKPEIMKLASHFPILNVLGTRGSGKTSLIAELLRLLAFKGETFSCSLSEFRWIKILSSTNCFPVAFDEFKTSDLPSWQIDMIKQIIRRAYTNTIETRGKADQSMIEYPLHAPFILIGESVIQDSAVLERLVPVSLSFQELKAEYKLAFKKFRQLPLHTFQPYYLKWALQQNVQEIWNSSRTEVCQVISHLSVSERVIDNMATAIFGLKAMNLFASQYFAAPLDYDLKLLVEYFNGEVTEDQYARIAIDDMLEKLSDIAEKENSDELVMGIHYLLEEDCLYLRLKPAVDIFRSWANKCCYKGEILEEKAYRKMLKERLDEYITEISAMKYFNRGRARCVCIDLIKAEKMGLHLKGFKQPCN